MSSEENPWYGAVTRALADTTLLFSHYRFGESVPAWRVNFAEPIASTVVIFVGNDDWVTIQTEPVDIPGLTMDDVFDLQSHCMLARLNKDPDGVCAQLDIHKNHVSTESIMIGLGAVLTLLGQMHRARDARTTPPA